MIMVDYKAERKQNDEVIRKIQKYKAYLTKQQYRTLIGQAKAGNREAAIKGLNKLLMRVARDYQAS